MTEHAYPPTATADARDAPRPRTGPVRADARWTGKLVFGGVIMIVAGLLNVIIGIVALFNSDYYIVGPSGPLVLDLTGWGWLHLILGALVAVTGGALFTGAAWARVITVLLAGFNALAT
ncbi:MAG TPA: hypothetical protein VHC18_27780, partial [Amycolatopsis sp.]|nr:hypothetical protein [Amycolatopsis sp.]